MKDGADSSREAMGLGDGWVKEWNRTGISIIRIISTSWQRPHSFSCDAILPLLYFPLFSAFRWLRCAVSLSLSLSLLLAVFLPLLPSEWFLFLVLIRSQILAPFLAATLRCIPLRPEELTATFPSFLSTSSTRTSSRWFFCLGTSAFNRVQVSSKRFWLYFNHRWITHLISMNDCIIDFKILWRFSIFKLVLW